VTTPPCLTGTIIRSRQILGRSAHRGLCHLVKCPECGHVSDGHGRHLRHMRIEDYLHPTNPSSNPHKFLWFNAPEKLFENLRSTIEWDFGGVVSIEIWTHMTLTYSVLAGTKELANGVAVFDKIQT
jgi:hypothetical protein